MTKHFVSFPGPAMTIPNEEIAAVGEAKNAGVCEFAEGIGKNIAPLTVAANGFVTNKTGTCAWSAPD